jgi:hypothetical protein
MFASKEGLLSTGRLQTLPAANIRQGWKWLEVRSLLYRCINYHRNFFVTNPLDYYGTELITAVKRFVVKVSALVGE